MLQTTIVICSCGHQETALMDQATIDYITRTRGGLFRETPCKKCLTPEMDPRNCER